MWHTALLKRTYDSKICGRKKNVNVLLPAGYTTAKKYPVLYVLHGYCASTTQDKCTGLDAQNGTMHIWHTVTGGKTIRPHMYNYIRAIFHAS